MLRKSKPRLRFPEKGRYKHLLPFPQALGDAYAHVGVGPTILRRNLKSKAQGFPFYPNARLGQALPCVACLPPGDLALGALGCAGSFDSWAGVSVAADRLPASRTTASGSDSSRAKAFFLDSRLLTMVCRPPFARRQWVSGFRRPRSRVQRALCYPKGNGHPPAGFTGPENGSVSHFRLLQPTPMQTSGF